METGFRRTYADVFANDAKESTNTISSFPSTSSVSVLAIELVTVVPHDFWHIMPWTGIWIR
tara:strand:- start:7 stop:189 length:183 start_codon:yes stop_codon:yes gene_type:complete